MNRPLGLYVHIPFCLRKCAYCDFPSYPDLLGQREAYTRALIREIESRGERLGRPGADTLFIGGGTPSLMVPAQMAGILKALQAAFPWDENMEATCEANPETLTPDFLAALMAGGINRLSLGAQASQPHLLRAIGRGHSWEQVISGVRMAREAGIPSINLDVMMGLPGQTAQDMAQTMEAALDLAPEHLSCYSLILEEGTPLFDRVAAGAVSLPDEDSLLLMETLVKEKLMEAGYHHYEVSNFARLGHACRHNLNCWQYEDYLGFGAAAAGFYHGIRRKNPESLADYLNGDPPEENRVGPEESRFEQVMLGLRMTAGLDAAAFEKRQGMTLMEAFGRPISKHLAGGLLAWEGGRLRLTGQGEDLMNRVLVDFLQ